MNTLRTILTSLSAAAFLVACGGGGSDDNRVDFTSVISFGDSLSDVGTYKVGTVAQLGGGKFTVNGPDGKVWTEYLAESLGAPAQCAARTGMLPNNGVTGAAIENFPACSNYAQGSSRVTAEGSGPNGVALQTALAEQNLGFMADSIGEQMNRHLAKTGGRFGGSGIRELVTVNGGANDLFMQLRALGAAGGGGSAAQATATVAGWPADVVTAVAAGGAPAVNAAAGAAVAAMGQAGAELAGYIKTRVVANGAEHVVVRNLADVNITPFGRSLDDQTRGLITAMTQAFNDQLKAGLDGVGGVLLFDDYAQSADVVANTAKYGFSNITDVACANNPFGGSSLICTEASDVEGSSRYAFADTVHPTPYSHRQEADAVLSMMRSAGWVFRVRTVANSTPAGVPLHQQVGTQRRVFESAVLAWHGQEQTRRRGALGQLGADLDSEIFAG